MPKLNGTLPLKGRRTARLNGSHVGADVMASGRWVRFAGRSQFLCIAVAELPTLAIIAFRAARLTP
jgi:hypothetical protein